MGTDLIVAHPSSGRSWTIAQSPIGSLQGVKLAAAPDGAIWVFWTASGPDGEREDVFGRVLRLGRWSPARRMADPTSFPRTGLDAASGADGTTWLTWAEFDGRVYRVVVMSGTRAKWGRPVVLSAAGGLNALSPSMAFVDGLNPAVCWTQAESAGEGILLVRLGREGVWSEPVQAAPGPVGSPRLAGDAGRLGFAWRSGETILTSRETAAGISRGRAFRPAAPAARIAAAGPMETRPLLFNPDLKDTAYIAFGDSMTAGQLGGVARPDISYPTKLNTLLDAAFGPTDVFNEGSPGELTEQGLLRMPGVIARDKARFLLLLEGTNDTKILSVSMDTAAFNLKQMLRACLNAGMLPAISTILPRYDWYYQFPEYKDRLLQLNASIRLMAADLKVPLVDLNDIFVNWPPWPDGVYELLDTDAKHPSEMGYQVMAEKWRDLIRTFPFPPESIQGSREYDKILFSRRLGAWLTWTPSPKIADASKISGIRVYRRKEGESKDMFRLITTLDADSASHFDTTIDASTVYEYVLTTLRTDGMEGPCSALVRIR